MKSLLVCFIRYCYLPSLSLLLVVLLSGCGEEKMILGAGSTFDNLLFSKMLYTYYLDSGVKVNYQSIGSGGGIKSLTDKIVDFAASDAVLTTDQERTMSATVLHIPVTCGAIVLSYHLPEVKDTLKFTPAIIAGIFLGTINRWDDTAIVRANLPIHMPARDIIVIHRSDGSGTTNIFTHYLSKVSPHWDSVVGKGSAVNWPTGIGGKGNEGVAGGIQQTVGSVGYIELAYAIKNDIPYAKVQNKTGNFITPSVASVSEAANIQLPPDGKAILANTDAPQGYPISGFSWILLYKEQQYNARTAARAGNVVKLINWMIHDGQRYSKPLYYAPLSVSAVKAGEQMLRQVTYHKTTILE